MFLHVCERKAYLMLNNVTDFRLSFVHKITDKICGCFKFENLENRCHIPLRSCLNNELDYIGLLCKAATA